MSKAKVAENLPELVNVKSITQGMLTSYEQLPISDSMMPVCTWQLTTVEGRARLHQLIAGQSLVLWDLCAGKPVDILVTDLAASYGSYEPEDKPGEVVEGPMFYLCGPDGNYHTGSAGVYKSMQQLALIEGPPPWQEPVILRCQRVQTRNLRDRLAVTFLGRAVR